MKKLILATLVLFSLFQSVQARGIVGKWYCTNAFLDSLGQAYYFDDINGSIEFKEDGWFTLLIDGSQLVSRSSSAAGKAWGTPSYMKRKKAIYRNLYVKVAGRYQVHDGRITTTVSPKDVVCFVSSGRESPKLADMDDSDLEARWKQHRQLVYEQAETNSERQANTIKTEKEYLWVWNNEPIVITADCISVGDWKVFTSKRGVGWGEYMAQYWKKPHKYAKVLNKTAGRAIEIIQHPKAYTEKKHSWALRKLSDITAGDSVSYYLFYLGLAYLDGIGVASDVDKAVTLLEKAGQAGYDRAYNVLGNMYKQGGNGVRQDFRKAYHYYCTGAERGHNMCIYYKGLMQYKGLGCRQDYKEAAMTFLTSANDRDANSLYMLGLCSRNGYGLAKDSAAALFCLQRAARMHCPEASEELMRPHEETYMHDVYANAPKYSYIPDSLPDVRPSAVAVDLPAGDYRGFIVTYDWSGKYILDERPFAMTLNGVTGGGLSGMLTVGDKSAKFCGTLSGGRLVFTEGGLTMPDRYVRGGKQYYDLGDMALEACGGKVRGRLSLKSRSRKEPGNPMYFELVGNASGTSAGTE